MARVTIKTIDGKRVFSIITKNNKLALFPVSLKGANLKSAIVFYNVCHGWEINSLNLTGVGDDKHIFHELIMFYAKLLDLKYEDPHIKNKKELYILAVQEANNNQYVFRIQITDVSKRPDLYKKIGLFRDAEDAFRVANMLTSEYTAKEAGKVLVSFMGQIDCMSINPIVNQLKPKATRYKNSNKVKYPKVSISHDNPHQDKLELDTVLTLGDHQIIASYNSCNDISIKDLFIDCDKNISIITKVIVTYLTHILNDRHAFVDDMINYNKLYKRAIRVANYIRNIYGSK